MLQDGIDALGLLAIQQPSGKVDAIAAEVNHGTAAVLLRVGQPREEHPVAPNLLWSLMSVIDVNAMDFAQLASIHKRLEVMVRVVPRRFVVRHDLNAVLLGEFLHLEGMLVSCGERFLHHDVDAALGTSFHRLHVMQDASVIDHHLGLFLVEHLGERGIELLLGQPADKVIVLAEVVILFSHTHDNEVAAMHGINKVPKMSVCHARHADSQRAVCHRKQ